MQATKAETAKLTPQEKHEQRRHRRAFTREFYRGSKGLMAANILFTVISSLLELMLSVMLQKIADIATGGTPDALRQCALLLAGLIIGFALIFAIQAVIFPRYLRRAMQQYKEFAFRQITRKSISSFAGENTSRYISALTNDASAIETNWLAMQFDLINQLLTCLGALALMFWYSPALTAWTIGLALLPLIGSILTGGRLAAREKAVSQRSEDFVDTVKDMLTGFTVIKSFKAEEVAGRLFTARNSELERSKCSRRRTSQAISILGSIAGLISQMGVFLVGAWMAITGQGVTAGMVMAFVQLCNYILSPIRNVPSILAGRKASMALVDKLAAAVQEGHRQDGRTVDNVLDDAIRLDNVSFAYEEGKPVLHDVNCTFERGKSYAIVGSSGSGKSTLLSLLMGGYDGYTGSMTIDGDELRTIASDSLFDLMCMVQQNVFIFNDTLRNNITMFRDFPEEQVQEAIRRSGLSVVVAAKGLDYDCGEGGKGLSGGERQRVSIARCLLRQTPVMLIDEATAALDNATAREVSESILNLSGLTRIVVTHRLEESLLDRYDGICVMRGGTLCEQGTFRELMAHDSYFRSLYTVSQD